MLLVTPPVSTTKLILSRACAGAPKDISFFAKFPVPIQGTIIAMPADPNAPSAEPEIKGKWNTSEDIFAILTRQHDEVKSLIERLTALSEAEGDGARAFRENGRRLAIELISHNEAESETLYARLAKIDDLRSLAEGHRREHEQVNAFLAPLIDGSFEAVEWPRRIGELRRAVEAHIADEEERLFPQAKERLHRREQKTLAGEFIYVQDLRKNLMQPV